MSSWATWVRAAGPVQSRWRRQRVWCGGRQAMGPVMPRRAAFQIGSQLAPPQHPEQHRQHRYRVPGRSRPAQQRRLISEHLSQPGRQLRMSEPGMTVTGQPAQVATCTAPSSPAR